MGRLALVGPAGEEDSLGKRRLKLALLAFLAITRRPWPREVLMEMFWGDRDDERAAHSLSDALSHLRQAMGRDAVTSRTDDVALSKDALLTVDAIELAEAARTGDHSRVVELYGGEFLDGIHANGSARFEDWLSRERQRLRGLYSLSSAELPRVEAGQPEAAAPASPSGPHRLLPSPAPPVLPEVTGAEIATGLAETRRETPGLRGEMGDVPGGFISRTVRGKRAIYAGVAAAVLGLAGLAWFVPLRASSRARARPETPRIAVLPIVNAVGDSANAWLERGLQQMLIADLSRDVMASTGEVVVIDPALLRDATTRAGNTSAAGLTASQAVSIASGTGATLAVTGSVTHSNSGYVLDLTVRRVANRQPLEIYTVSGTDVLTIAQRAAARILARAAADRSGPQFAEIETENAVAYEHFVRAEQAAEEGRAEEGVRELDAAISLDSGFVSAIIERIRAGGWADYKTINRLTPLLSKAGDRVGERDRLDLAATAAMHNGEHERAEAIARDLLAQFPRDPRSYALLNDVLFNDAKWSAADSLMTRLLSLDSLGTASAYGPCVPCWAYGNGTGLEYVMGNLPRAERSARKWVALESDLPASWAALNAVLTAEGRYDAAMQAASRAVELSASNPDYVQRLAMTRLEGNDYAAVDSFVSQWLASGQHGLVVAALDTKAMEEREQGRLRASNATLQRLVQVVGTADLLQVAANSMARLGERNAAAAQLQRIHIPPAGSGPLSPVQPLVGDVARAFSWHQALAAEALGATWAGDDPPAVDTVRLKKIADSIAIVSVRSYYGRDLRLPHHVRGLVDMAGHRYADAVRELEQARWGASGWTATNVALAESYLALKRPDSAVVVLRQALGGPLDAMGRYVPRSDIYFLMAQAFAANGVRDSASVYSGYVRRAWAEADPEVKRRLARLPN